MSTEKIYVCTHCQQWLRPNADVELSACPFCNGKLEQVPMTAEEFNAMDDATKKALADTYKAPAAQQPAAAPAKPSQPVPKAKGNSNNPSKEGCFGEIMVYVICICVSIGLFYLISNVDNWVHKSDSLQRTAKVSLNTIVDNGQEMPVGEFVSLNTRWVIGPIATETSTSSLGSGDGLTATTGVDYYYFCVLEDGTIIAIQTSNSKEVETLDRMSDWLLDVYGYPMDGETILLQGKLKKMTDREIIQIYNECLPVLELQANDPSVHYLILDTTAGRMGSVVLFGGIAVIIFAAVLIRIKSKNKKNARQASA